MCHTFIKRASKYKIPLLLTVDGICHLIIVNRCILMVACQLCCMCVCVCLYVCVGGDVSDGVGRLGMLHSDQCPHIPS